MAALPRAPHTLPSMTLWTLLAWIAVAGPGTLVWLWVAFAVGFMGTRCVTLYLRSRGDAWMRLGA